MGLYFSFVKDGEYHTYRGARGYIAGSVAPMPMPKYVDFWARSGNWHFSSRSCRSESYYLYNPDHRYYYKGFRLMLITKENENNNP